MRHSSRVALAIAAAALALGAVVNPNTNPLTFWWYAGDPTVLRPALECALNRIRTATCLPLDVSLDAQHWIRQKTDAEMGGRAGWTTGPWANTRIALKDSLQDYHWCPILTHEIVHVLRRSNAHPCPGRSMSSPDGVWSREPGASRINACDLEAICAAQDCGCYNPEDL